MRSSMGAYHALGVKNIKMTANIDVGGYAWARYGFVPASWPTIKRALLKRLDAIQDGDFYIKGNAQSGRKRRLVEPINSDAAILIRSILESKDPQTLWKIADLKIGDRSLGKDLLLDTKWSGVMDLNNSVTMARCLNYIRRTP